MREILFRGKDVYGKWLYGDLINLTDEIKQICNHTLLEHAHGVAPETVGQFTGLTDKNGKRIFEGDIIYMGLFPFVVKYDVENARYMLFDSRGSKRDGFNAFTMETHEVIGNIHDNPELLERSKNGF